MQCVPTRSVGTRIHLEANGGQIPHRCGLSGSRVGVHREPAIHCQVRTSTLFGAIAGSVASCTELPGRLRVPGVAAKAPILAGNHANVNRGVITNWKFMREPPRIDDCGAKTLQENPAPAASMRRTVGPVLPMLVLGELRLKHFLVLLEEKLLLLDAEACGVPEIEHRDGEHDQ
jgi:hypothetical protein